ncbi:hypothetical protein [Mycobacterium botniense]|uniref:PE family protein n=1 Tax=Mycobacterium botniense TaxID=84962 RepID=A0A7I9XTB9_9MYCO|nr:hypothetical protein [Mycobacterium botniense]GFG73214.1 hypothetical protein MBOT_05790 [Mycobacterium botniense]
MRVLAAGLVQLGTDCETISAGLAAHTAGPVVAASAWQSNVGAVNLAAAAARTNLGAIATRIADRGRHYGAAGAAYPTTDQDNAVMLRELVR